MKREQNDKMISHGKQKLPKLKITGLQGKHLHWIWF